MIDRLNKIVAHLRQQTKPEQMIVVRGMTPDQFEEYANRLTKSMSEFQGSLLDGMIVIGEELAPVFAEATELLLEAKRELENGIRESWIIILDHFIPESWARFVVSKVPSQIIWWTIR